MNRAEAEEVGVGADHVVGFAGHGALEELVVRGIPTHADHDLWPDEHGPAADSRQHRSGLTWCHSELAPDVRARGDRIDLGEDRLGDEQDELVSAPRLVDARREALSASERAPQENLSVKNDSGRGQRAPPRG